MRSRHLFLSVVCLVIPAMLSSLAPLCAQDGGSAVETLTLEQCLERARVHNRTLLSQKARVEAADARLKQVKAGQLPAVSAQWSDTSYNAPAGPLAAREQHLHRLILSDTVAPFGRYRSQKRAAEAAQQAARHETDKVEQDVDFQVAKLFYDLLLAQQMVRVASDSVDQLTSHRDNTAALVRAGSAPKFDLLRAEVQLASARPPLIKAQSTITNSMADLMNLLGLDPQLTPTLIGSFPEQLPEPPTEEEAVIVAQERRPDLAAARELWRSRKHQVAAARQALQPTVQLAQTWDHSKGLRTPVHQYQQSSFTQLNLSWPMFDSGLTRARVQEAQAAATQAELSAASAQANAVVEVRKALSAWHEAVEVLRSQEKNVEQATEALAIAKSAYKAGARTALDVLDAQVALTQARTLHYQAMYARTLAHLSLRRATGLPFSLSDAFPHPTALPERSHP